MRIFTFKILLVPDVKYPKYELIVIFMEQKINFSKENISNSELLEFEQSIGYELPRSYKKFILKNNGGVPDNEHFDEFKLSSFFPIKYGNNTVEKTYEIFKNLIPKGYLPIADDIGGWPICLDLNKWNTYGFVYLVHMDGPEIDFVAESFEEFLGGLTKEYI